MPETQRTGMDDRQETTSGETAAAAPAAGQYTGTNRPDTNNRNNTAAKGGEEADAVQEVARLRSRLQWYETHDSLTGLLNLPAFQKACGKALKSGQFGGTRQVIVFCNIHHFSSFNAKYGYDAGDGLLKTFVREMLRIFNTQLAARFSSDLFYLCTEQRGVQDRILELEQALFRLRKESYLLLQVGVYALQPGDDMVSACDCAKTAGALVQQQDRVCFRFYDKQLDQKVQLHRYIVEHIDSAIARGNILVYFQPVVRSLTGELCGAEALARWQDPVYHLMPPGEFIEVLEEERLIWKLDVYVLQQCCRLIHDRLEKGLPAVPLSFNVSRLDFELCNIYDELNSAVDRYRIPKEYINVEITERMMGNNARLMQERIERFHADGYQVWMDDFGSEYSSLNALKDVYFDELKIDMGFLRDFSDRSRRIITSVVEMAKRLGIQTLAEGVETREQFVFLQSIGCEKIQGYYFGWPMPAKELEEHLEERNISFEKARLRHYYDQIGTVNLLNGAIVRRRQSQEIMDSVLPEENTVPLSLIEEVDGVFHYRYANEAFRSMLDSMGVYSMADAEDRLNKPQLALSRIFRKLVHSLLEKGGIRHMNYVQNDNYCTASATIVARTDDRLMLAGSVMNLSENTNLHRNEVMDGALRAMYTMYEEVLVACPATNEMEPVFIEKEQQGQEHKWQPLREYAAQAERTLVYPEDRERYHSYTDASTIIRRIMDSGKTFISDFFRLRDRNGAYSWKTILGILIPDRRNDKVLICVRPAFPDDAHVDTLITAILESAAEGGRTLNKRTIQRILPADVLKKLTGDTAQDLRDSDTPTAADLWKNMVMNTSLIGFWKDRQRRFLGVTQAFLDYYHLESQDDVVGKTDEEMHWHVDPLPFHVDEDRVLETGVHLTDQPGSCIIQGEQHEILASKFPIYRHGTIVGLMGFAYDVTSHQSQIQEAVLDLERDRLTGLMNLRGIMNAAMHFMDAFVTKKTDFVLLFINISGFQRMMRMYGPKVAEQILVTVGESLRENAGRTAVVGRIASDQFAALQQIEGDFNPEDMIRTIQDSIGRIHIVADQPVTIYVRCGYGLVSQCRTVDRMLRKAAQMAGGSTLIGEAGERE